MKIILKILKNFIVILKDISYVIKDTVLRLQGYVRLNEIKIPSYYTRPEQEKLEKKKDFYKRYKTLPQIIINENEYLVDGFCTYFLAAVWNWDYVKVRRVKSVKNVRRKNKK